jgi:hypothetical protein
MKTSTLIILLNLTGITLGCVATTQGSEPRTAELEKENAALRKKDDAMKAKLAIIRKFPFGSPLEEFFASSEFWECTYDSGASDCAARCASEAATLRNACAEKPTCEDRTRCYEEAAQRAAACVQACPRPQVPTDPSICL